MSAIAGVLQLDSGPVDPRTPARMVERLAHRGPDGRNIWHRGVVGLGHCLLRTTPESAHEAQPLLSDGGAVALVADARLDNREELLAALDLRSRAADQRALTDAHLILAAYQEWGEETAAHLLGDFALAIWDQDHRRLYCARDHIGVKSLYYFHGASCFAFATEIKALFEVPGVSREIDEERLASHLTLDFDNLENTFYRDVRRLPPAHWLVVGDSGARRRRYWALDPQRELGLGSDDDYQEAFRELFLESVRCRLRSTSPVGATLSGGLDSSSICCAARQILSAEPDSRLHTFSLVFPGLTEGDLRRIDERRYVDAVVADGGFESHRVPASELSPLDDLEEICRHLDEPHVPFNLYLHLGLYRAAQRRGLRVLLDGFDGDTTVYWGLGRLAELTASLRWLTLAREIRAFRRRTPNPAYTSWRIVREYSLSPLMPSAVRSWLRLIRLRAASEPVRQGLIAGPFAQRVGLGEGGHNGGADRWRSFRTARQDHLMALESPLVPWCLELADKAAGAVGLDLRYPFFDRRMMEFCLSLPADQKLRDGWTRWILRTAMHGILPPEVQWRRGKADLSPNFHRGLRASDGQRLRSLLADHAEALSGFVDLQALEEILRSYLEDRAPQGGMPLISALALGVWLRQAPVDGRFIEDHQFP